MNFIVNIVIEVNPLWFFLVLLAIMAFAVLILSIYAFYKESEITGMYKAFDVYGRIKAYMFANFVTTAVAMIIGSLTDMLFLHKFSMVELLLFIAVGVLCGAITNYLYRSSKSKCPEGPLKENLMRNMLISGVGISVKIVTLLIFFTAKVLEPRKAVDEKGLKCVFS